MSALLNDSDKAAMLHLMDKGLDNKIKEFPFSDDLCFSGFEEIIPKILYLYLFKGLSLRDIDRIVIESDRMKGWFSKVILNYAGVQTDIQSGSKGIFEGFDIKCVIQALRRMGNDQSLRLAYYLSLL